MTILTPEQIDYISTIAAENATSIEDAQNIVKQIVGPIIEKMLEGEMTGHLGYKKHSIEGKNTGNSRNGHSTKKIRTSSGEIGIAVPRDRQGDFIPQILPKYQTNTSEIEQKIINMYALGLTTKDITDHVKDIYGAEISSSTVSRITDQIIPEIQERQSRPLEKCYPIIYLDAIHYKVKNNGIYQNQAVYIILGIGISGKKDVLGLIIGASESASFWQTVCNNLVNRGVEDVLIACIDGLVGFSNAIRNSFPEAKIQRCIVHQIRSSLKYVAHKDSKEFMNDLKSIYKAMTKDLAESNLVSFDKKRGDKYPISTKSWVNNWEDLSTYFLYPPEIRKIIYTTNTIEGYNRQLRKVTKTTSIFPSEQSLLKLLYLATKNITKKWGKSVNNRGPMLNQFHVFFPERIGKYLPIGS